MSKLRQCIVDNVKYKYCGNCEGYDSTETWRYIYCCDNCKQIYQVIDKYKAGRITDQEAYEMLNKLDLSKSKDFTDLVKGFYYKITLTVKETVKEKEEKQEDKSDSTTSTTKKSTTTQTTVKKKTTKTNKTTKKEIDE